MRPEVRVALVAYPGVSRSALFGLLELFETTNRWAEPGSARIRVHCWNGGDENICSHDDAIPLDPQAPLPAFGESDVVIVPPGSAEPEKGVVSAELSAWLRRCKRDGVHLASACVGAYILAEGGVLDGHCVTTHWMLAESFRTRFPQVSVATEHLLVADGEVTTAGGTTAWIDLAVYLVSQKISQRAGMRLGAYFLLDSVQREQRYYRIFSPPTNHGDAVVERAQSWIHDRFREQFEFSVLTGELGISPRTFQRRFQSATGLTPSAYLQRVRLQAACEQLATSPDSLESIVWGVGYRDISAFRRLFKARVGITPSAYRKRFGH